jgi:nitrate/nitrite transporter NarK
MSQAAASESGQKTWLVGRLAAERARREAVRKYTLGEALRNPKIWMMTIAYFSVEIVPFGLVFFMLLIVKGLGVSTTQVGIVSAVSYLFTFVAMLFWGWHSDRTGERTWHVVGACVVCAGGLAACVVIGVSHPIVTMVALTFAAIGLECALPLFWSLPSAILTGAAAAGGIALINSAGGLGGWFGPTLFGLVKDATGSDNIGLLSLAAGPVVCAILLVLAGHDRRLERIPPRS